MTYAFAQAETGNVALMGELGAAEGVLTLGLAQTPQGARALAAASLAEGYDPIRQRFLVAWREWGGRLQIPAPTPELAEEACRSAMVLKVHEDRPTPELWSPASPSPGATVTTTLVATTWSGPATPSKPRWACSRLAKSRTPGECSNNRRMLDSLKVADALLRVETPCGPAYHRYNRDGYGEHENGSPFDGTGIGRAWPLMVGERVTWHSFRAKIHSHI